jgi:hypothetical protein
MARLTCRSAVRQFTLDAIKSRRPHLSRKLTRVSDDFFVTMEAK